MSESIDQLDLVIPSIERGYTPLVISPQKIPPKEPLSDRERDELIYKPVKMYYRYRKLIEKIEPKNSISITVTFTDKVITTDRHEIQRYLCSLFKKELHGCSRDVRVFLVYEYSDVGRFHYHGIIENVPANRLANIGTKLRKYFGRIELSQIRNWDNYTEYMLKRYMTESAQYEKLYDERNDVCFVYNHKAKDIVSPDFYVKRCERINQRETACRTGIFI